MSDWHGIMGICMELRNILDLHEFEHVEIKERLDLDLAVLPPSEQERIRQKIAQGELRPIAVSGAIHQIFIETYEAVQKSVRQQIKEYCERCVRDASEIRVETEWLKQCAQQLAAGNFVVRGHPAIAEIRRYSDTESPATLYSLLLRLFSQKEWFPNATYTLAEGRFFREAELLQRLASATGRCLSEAIEQDKPQHHQQYFEVLWYIKAFGPHVSFRIKNAFVHEKYAEIFTVLGHDFHIVFGWAELVGAEKQKRLVELFGRLFRYHCSRRFPSDWKSLRDLLIEFECWDVGCLVHAGLGSEKEKLLRDWISRAKKAAKPDCSQEAMEELLKEIETVSTKPIEFSALIEGFVKALGEDELDPHIFDPNYDSESGLRYYPTILFQERMEAALDNRSWGSWTRIDRRWKLRAIGRSLRGLTE
jgi:hypothetical protein